MRIALFVSTFIGVWGALRVLKRQRDEKPTPGFRMALVVAAAAVLSDVLTQWISPTLRGLLAEAALAGFLAAALWGVASRLIPSKSPSASDG